MTRPLATAYAASVARVAGWAVVLGVVFRTAGEHGTANVAVLAYARATVGLLGYLSLGLTPVLVRELTPTGPDDPRPQRAYSTSGLLIAGAGGVGLTALLVFILHVAHAPVPMLATPRQDAAVFLGVGLGTLLRACSDWFASLLLAGGRIATDGLIQTAAEATFVVATLVHWTGVPAVNAACGFAASGGVLMVGRAVFASRLLRPRWSAVDRRLAWPIAVLGAGVLVGQLADWLYAPLNQILIRRFLGSKSVAAYAVAIQVDGGLLLLVGGLAAVLLPTAARAAREGRFDALRRQYVRATLAGLLLLTLGAAAVCVFARSLFIAWFGDDMPAARAVLPWVMLHTVVGGTAAVGRAVLLGVGRVRAYTLSAVFGGVANAALAAVIVTQTALGLRGVVLATVVTVALRCGVWMPWFTLRCLRDGNRSPI